MDIRQNPFSVYDFLGYLIPGAFALYVLAALGAWAVPGLTFYGILEEYLSFGTPEAYIPFVIGAYVAGHVFSYLSSVTVEKYSVYAYGYPSKYLLGWEFPGYLEIGNTDKPRRRKIWRVVLFLVLLPVTVLDLVVGKWMGGRELYARSLDDRLSESVKESVAPLIARFAGTPAELADVFKEDTDLFRFLYHFGLEQSKGHLSKFQNYVALYGVPENPIGDNSTCILGARGPVAHIASQSAGCGHSRPVLGCTVLCALHGVCEVL
jgi:hypothetical protein